MEGTLVDGLISSGASSEFDGSLESGGRNNVVVYAMEDGRFHGRALGLVRRLHHLRPDLPFRFLGLRRRTASSSNDEFKAFQCLQDRLAFARASFTRRLAVLQHALDRVSEGEQEALAAPIPRSSILSHLKLPLEFPSVTPARAPPEPSLPF